MPRKGWTSVSIPEDLATKIDEEISSSGGWTSRADLVKYAVRRLLEEINKAQNPRGQRANHPQPPTTQKPKGE